MRHVTAGEKSLKAASDTTAYDSLEVGYALTDDIQQHLADCIKDHNPKFDMDEYCVIMQLAGDQMLKNIMRKKFYAWPFLPKPRPSQTVFLYNKRQHRITKRLWVLPHVLAMETLYETQSVAPQFRTMKAWSHAFYDGCFWAFIRKQHGIDMLSESEYLDKHREELIKAGCKYPEPGVSESFDFSKITVNQVVDSYVSVP